MSNDIWSALEGLAPFSPDRMREIEYRDNQSAIGYMADALPIIDRLFSNHHWNTQLRSLDVGSRSGAGTALLADLHMNGNSWVRFDATGLELETGFEQYVKFRFPNIRYLVGDVFDHEERYDLITCNHVIEHFPDPRPIIEKMKSLCDGFVVTGSPWREMTLIDEHKSRFDPIMLHYLQPTEHHVYTNRNWRARGDCVIMIFDCRKDKSLRIY
jgi:2-polyprenyl-3-methyl-5-hydroxy-6-metoxy-1,4-benzoquinol methylase